MPEARLYQSITKLPYKLFKTACVESDLSVLVMEGEPSETELHTLWQALCDQYADGMGTANRKQHLSLVKQVGQLSADYNSLMLLLDQLENAGYVKIFADEVNKLLFTKFAFDIQDIEAFDEDISASRARAAAIKINLELKTAQYDAVEKKMSKEGGERPTYEYFIKLETSLSNHVQFHLDFEKLSTYEFCLRVKQLSDYVDAQKK